MPTEAFTEYLKRNGVKYTPNAGGTRVKIPTAAAAAQPWHIKLDPSATAAAASKSPSPMDAISTILDLLDRPRRAVAQTMEAVGDAGYDAIEGKFDLGKSLGNVATAIPRGLFSTAKSDQETSSEELRHFTSRAAKTQVSHDLVHSLTGKTYQDKDIDKALDSDVSKVLQGVGGFALDVGTDPLTYVPIPIAPLARGAKAAGAGAKALLGAKGAKAAVEVAAKGEAAAAKTAAEAVVPTVSKDVSEAAPPVDAAPAGFDSPTVGAVDLADIARRRDAADKLSDELSAKAQAIEAKHGEGSPRAERAWDKYQKVYDEYSRLFDEHEALKKAKPATVAESAAPAAVAAPVSGADDALDALKTPAPIKPADYLAQSKQGQGLVKFLDEIETPKTVTEPGVAAAAPARKVPLSKGEWATAMKAGAATLDEDANAATGLTVRVKTDGGSVTMPLSRVLKDKKYQNRDAMAQVQKHYDDYVKSFAVSTAPNKVLPPAEWAKAFRGSADDAKRMPTVSVKGADGTAQELPLSAVLRDKELGQIPEVRAQIQAHYQRYAEAFDIDLVHGGKGIGHLGGPLAQAAEAAPVEAPKDVVRELTARDQFQHYLRNEKTREELETIIGGTMVTALARYRTNETFAAAIAKVRDRLSQFVDLSAPLPKGGTASTPQGALWASLGLDADRAHALHEAARSFEKGDLEETLTQIVKAPEGARVASGTSVEADVAAVNRDRLGKDLKPDKGEYAFQSEKAERTAQGFGVGRGVIPGIDEMVKQEQVLGRYGELVDNGFKEQGLHVKADGSRLLRPERAAAKREAVLERLKMHFALRKQLGIPARMSWRPNPKPNGIEERAYLDLHEVLSTMAAHHPEAARLVDQLFFHPGLGTSPANFQEGIARLVAGHPIEDVLDTVTRSTDVWGKPLKATSFLAQDTPKPWKVVPDARMLANVPDALKRPYKNGTAILLASPQMMKAELAGLLEQLRPGLQALSEANAGAFAERAAGDVTKLTSQKIDEITALAQTSDLDKMTAEIAGLNKTVPVAAREAADAPAAVAPAVEAVQTLAPVRVPEAAEQVIKVDRATKPEAAAEAQGKMLDDEAEGLTKTADEEQIAYGLDQAADAGVPVDLSQSVKEAQVARGVAGGAYRVIDHLSYMFRQDHLLGNGLWQMMHDGMAGRKALDNQRREALSAVWNRWKGMSDDGKNTIFDVEFRKLQAGNASDHPAAAELKDLLAKVLPLDTETHSILSSPAFLTAKGLPDENAWHYLNSQMDTFDGLKGHKFDLQAAAAEAGQRGGQFEGDFPRALASQWHSWDIADPKQFMLDIQRMTAKVAVDASTARSVVRELGTLVHVGPDAAGKMVPLTAGKSSSFSAFLPKGLHADPEVAWGLQRMDQIMRESMTLTSPVGQFIQKTLDPLLQAWKRAITVLRPGHHIRNGIGDGTQTYWAEGLAFSRKAASAAWQIMALKKTYPGVDLVKGLESMGAVTIKDGAVISGGKFGQISANTLYEAALLKGLLPDAKVIDDIAITAPDADTLWAKGLNRATFNTEGSKIGHVVHTVTEARDHMQRMHHFVQVIMKAQRSGKVDMGFRGMVTPKDQQELFKLAAEKVIRAHPDASLLTPFEYKYMRRVFPFYSWMRGALPFTLAHAMRFPGRATATTKASYNLAVAMGVNPDSLADPFPADQLFPSFLTEDMQGPQFKIGGDYFSASPGLTMWDVPNTFANPVEGIAGLLNPLARAPIELGTGSKLGTQGKIKDTSDYVDQNIPGVNYLANMTGISPTGSVVQTLRAGLGQGNNPLDAQYAVAAGQKSGGLAAALGATNENVDPNTHQMQDGSTAQGLSFFSFLSGLGPQDYSQPGYVNYAEIEQRNRAAEEAKKLARQ